MSFKPKVRVSNSDNVELLGRPKTRTIEPEEKYEYEEQEVQPAANPGIPRRQIAIENTSKIKQPISKFVLTEVPTETSIVIVDQVSGKSYDVMSALVWIMNRLDEFEEEEYR